MKRRMDSEFGKDFYLIYRVIADGLKAGARHVFWRTLAGDKELLRRVVDFVYNNAAYEVVVNYRQSLAEMIRIGRYDWANKFITKDHFPAKGRGEQKLRIILLHFNRAMKGGDVVLKIMEEQGYRPATIEELLAFGKKYRDFQREFNIVALGSVWRDEDGDGNVSYLTTMDSRRYLGLGDFKRTIWLASARFAAVRK